MADQSKLFEDHMMNSGIPVKDDKSNNNTSIEEEPLQGGSKAEPNKI